MLPDLIAQEDAPRIVGAFACARGAPCAAAPPSAGSASLACVRAQVCVISAAGCVLCGGQARAVSSNLKPWPGALIFAAGVQVQHTRTALNRFGDRAGTGEYKTGEVDSKRGAGRQERNDANMSERSCVWARFGVGGGGLVRVLYGLFGEGRLKQTVGLGWVLG